MASSGQDCFTIFACENDMKQCEDTEQDVSQISQDKGFIRGLVTKLEFTIVCQAISKLGALILKSVEGHRLFMSAVFIIFIIYCCKSLVFNSSVIQCKFVFVLMSDFICYE